MRLIAGLIVVAGCVLVQVSPVLAASFVLENVTIGGGDTLYRAPRIEVVDSPLSQEDFVGVLSGAGVDAPSQRAARLSAARITIPELASGVAANGADQTVTYRDVVLNDVVAGRIGHAMAAGATFTMKRGTGDVIAGHTGPVVLDGVDLPALAHILAEGRNDPAEASRVNVAGGRIADVEVDLPGGGHGHIGTATVRDLGGRALVVPMTSLLDLHPKADSAPPTPERRQALSGLFADLISSQSIGVLDLTDVSVRGAAPDASGAAIDHFVLSGVANAKIARASLDGLSTTSAGATSSIAHLAIAGVDLTPMLAASVADTQSRAPFCFDRIELDGLKAHLPNEPGQPVAVSLAHAQVEAHAWSQASPQALTFGLDRLGIDLPPDDPHARPLRDLGYDHLDLTAALATNYNPATLELTLGKATVAAPTVGSAALSLRMTDVGPGALSFDAATSRAALAASLFRHATAAVTDDGLLSRLLETQAKASRTSAADIRARWATSARASLLALLADNADRVAVAEAAERFVRNGGTLTIDADAPTGLGLIDLMLAGGLPGLIGKVKLMAGN